MLYISYQLYLFSQLFHLKLDKYIEDTPYDLLFPIVEYELLNFLSSDFNDENKSEYNCMEEFLNAHADRISITISDHANL